MCFYFAKLSTVDVNDKKIERMLRYVRMSQLKMFIVMTYIKKKLIDNEKGN